MHHARRHVYYWKCDRAAAFYGTAERTGRDEMRPALQVELRRHFGEEQLEVWPGHGQGNHLTYHTRVGDQAGFVRVEDGPERDDYLEVESAVLARVREAGVPAPRVLACDASRARVPYAWQVLETISHPDLNHWLKNGSLVSQEVAFAIGHAIAAWQGIKTQGFGPFDLASLRSRDALFGYHAAYRDYFKLRFAEHLRFLQDRAFVCAGDVQAIEAAVREHEELLELPGGVLVHKDLALWNVLGTPDKVMAYIDFDDAIAGDTMDDLALLGCFHDGDFLLQAMAGYESVRPFAPEFQRRFWLHLLRNMIVKSVIRVGAGYFERGDGFFLIDSGRSGADLRTFTLQRLFAALTGLQENRPIATL